MPDSPPGAAGPGAGSAVAPSSRSSAMLSSVYGLRAGAAGCEAVARSVPCRLERRDALPLAIGPQSVERRPRAVGDGIGRFGGRHAAGEHDHHVASTWGVDDAGVV